jgi:hypothetical protein
MSSFYDSKCVYVKSQIRIRPSSISRAPKTRISASGVLESFAQEADPHLGRNISTRDAESLLAALGHLTLTALEADPLLGR